MPRSPLMRSLQRLAAVHREAAARGVPVAALRDEHLAALTRRDFLKGAAGVAGLAALSSPVAAWAQSFGEPRSVAIVGAGIAGLTVATLLHGHGLAVTVYEAGTDVGGRMHSNTTDWLNGQTSEWCGELIDSGHVLMQRLARQYDLPLVDLRQAEPPGSEDTFFFGGVYYPEAQADADFAPVFRTLVEQQRAAPFPTTYKQHTPAAEALDALSVAQWIDRFVPGGHGSPLGQLLDVAYTIEYGADAALQSSLNLLYLLGTQPTPHDLSLFGASDERYHIAGGNAQLPQAMAAELPRGTVQFGSRLTAIARRGDRVSLTIATPGGTQQVTADHAILTLPFSVLRTLDYSGAGFDALKQRAITQLGYGTNCKLQLQFDTRYWNQTGPWPGVSTGASFSDVGYQNTWEVTRGQAGATGILNDYTGGSIGAAFAPQSPYSNSGASDTAAYAATFLTQLERVYPGISAHYTGRATLSAPHRDPNLLGSYSCWLVGQYTGFSGYERVRQGNIHFAGEHCSTSFQGYMEGAAQEGLRAAREVVEDAG